MLAPSHVENLNHLLPWTLLPFTSELTFLTTCFAASAKKHALRCSLSPVEKCRRLRQGRWGRIGRGRAGGRNCEEQDRGQSTYDPVRWLRLGAMHDYANFHVGRSQS